MEVDDDLEGCLSRPLRGPSLTLLLVDKTCKQPMCLPLSRVSRVLGRLGNLTCRNGLT